MTDRPSFTTIVDWVEGRLDRQSAAPVEAALAAGDPRTRGAIAWVRTFHEVAAELPLIAPPARVRYYLRRRFDERTDVSTARGGAVRRLLAALVFDSRTEPSLAGVRGSDVGGDAVHLAFRSDAGDVLLDLTRVREGVVRVDGQVLWSDAPTVPRLEAVVRGPDIASSTAEAGDLGRFTFPQVQPGIDQLTLRCGDLDVTMKWKPYDAS